VLAAFIIVSVMMDTARTSETSVHFYQTTRHYSLEDSHLDIRLSSFISLFIAS
jgi:hypothetical protein